jgi:O-antigen/teichoic acid export membrane protein
LLKDIKNTIIESAIYGLSRISNKLVGFIIFPLISVYFGLNEYGIIVRIDSLWQILWAIFLFGFESGIVRWYTLIPNTSQQKKFLFTASLFLLLINLIFILVFYLSSGILSKVLFDNFNYNKLIIYAALIAFSEVFSFLVFLILRIEKKAALYTIFSILYSIILLALQYYFIVYTSYKIDGIFISKILAPVTIIILLFPYYIKHLKIGIDYKNFIELLKYSFPILAGGLAVTLLNQSDKYILGIITSSDNVGIYGLSAYIAGLITMLIVSPFSLSFTVYSWQKLKDDNAKRFYTKSITYLFFVCLTAALCLSLFIPHVIKIFAAKPEYWLATPYVPWLALSVSFYGIHFISVFSFYVTKNTKYIFYSYFLSLTLNILLNYILIPLAGISGTVAASMISYFMLPLTLYLFSKSQYYFSYEWLKIFKLISVYSLLFTAKIISIFLFPVFLYFIKFFEPIEIEKIKLIFLKYSKLKTKRKSIE